MPPLASSTSETRRPTIRDRLLLLLRRVRVHVALKSTGTAAFMILFFIAYFAVLNGPHASVFEVPRIAPDRWIGFQPWALVPYLSLWLYVSLPASLMVRFRELLGHAIGAAVLAGAGLLIFNSWPTSTPASGIDWTQHPQFQFLKQVDAGGNACPSLHVAFAVFAALWLARLARRLGAGTCVRTGNVIWAGLIIFSTIATRQHVTLDVVAGALLGWLVARINLLLSPEPSEPPHLKGPAA